MNPTIYRAIKMLCFGISLGLMDGLLFRHCDPQETKVRIGLSGIFELIGILYSEFIPPSNPSTSQKEM